MQNLILAGVGNILFVCAFFALMNGLAGCLIVEAFFGPLHRQKSPQTKWSQETKAKVIFAVLMFVLSFWFYVDYKHVSPSFLHFELLLNIGLSHFAVIAGCLVKMSYSHCKKEQLC